MIENVSKTYNKTYLENIDLQKQFLKSQTSTHYYN